MLQIVYRNIHDKELQKLDTYRIGSWVVIHEPTSEDLGRVEKRYNLDASLLRDALDQHEVPRMEIENGIIYIFSRYPFQRQNHLTTAPILFVIGKEFIVSISKEKCASLDGFIKGGVFHTTQKTKLFLQLFTLINNAYNTYLHSISRQVASAYDLETINNKDIVEFVNYERVLSEFHLALVRTNAVLNGLLAHNYIKLYENDRDLMEDLFLSNDQLIQLSDQNLKSIVNIRDAYSTIITNNTNRVIRFFTSVTVILTIPTIIGSLFGMNVRLPYESHPFAFAGIMIFIVLITIALVFMFLKNDWL
jgi:magnesium transporter